MTLKTLSSTIFFTSLFFLNTTLVHAQNEYIVVEKTLSNKNITYSSGDVITYRLKDEDFYRTNHIVALNDTAIEFHYNNILYTDISHIDIKEKNLSKINKRSVGTKVQIAGIAYIAIDQFNQVVVRGEEASFNQGVWIAGGSIFLAGSLLKWVSKKKLPIGGKYRIRYMNIKK